MCRDNPAWQTAGGMCKDNPAWCRTGKKIYLFSEGGYDKNGNVLQEFRSGAFNCAQKAKVPIYYEEYKELTTQQISEIVKERIEEGMDNLEEQRIIQKFNRRFYHSTKKDSYGIWKKRGKSI